MRANIIFKRIIMKFDTIIIGGGLSGLISGIQLSKQGQRCVIISSGQSALHFSSGSFDLLNALPDGKSVNKPLEAIGELIEQAPAHPYAKLGTSKFAQLTAEAETFLQDTGIPTKGKAEQNHYRVTPMGTLKPTWLTLEDHLQGENANRIQWKKVGIFNVTGFLDFYTQFIVDELAKIGTTCTTHLINFPALERLRKNPTEMRSVNIARVFDNQDNLNELVRQIKAERGDCEIIALPAIVGLSRKDALAYLQKEIGKPVYLLPTLPPSVPGIQVQQQLRARFQEAGGVFMLGDIVLRAEKEGDRISRVYTNNHGDIPFTGKNVILATGSYFSQGLIADPERVYEPIFNLDITYSRNREQWYSRDAFEAQPYQTFGIKTDKDFRGLQNGKPIENLYVSGAILECFNAIKEGCGAGVSILSPLYVADRISSKQEML